MIVSYKMIISLKVMIEHSQSTQSNKFAISLQYLEQEVRNGFHLLHGDKHQSFYKLALSFLMEVAKHVQNTQNRKLVIFLQYIKKKLLQLPLCYIVMRNRYFSGVHSCSLLLVTYKIAQNNCEITCDLKAFFAWLLTGDNMAKEKSLSKK